jgi:hypothetical protein
VGKALVIYDVVYAGLRENSLFVIEASNGKISIPCNEVIYIDKSFAKAYFEH